MYYYYIYIKPDPIFKFFLKNFMIVSPALKSFIICIIYIFINILIIWL